MENVPLDRAKQVLEELVDRARHGEDVRITTADGSEFRLQPIEGDRISDARPAKRKAGRLKGKFEVPEKLFDPLPDDELKRWNEGDG
jgi:antitoxin (DNA-binding transcriptional repressor) of toxin-antitoxin stability system